MNSGSVVEPGGSWSSVQLYDRALDFAQKTAGRKRLLVWPAQPSDIVTALIASERSGFELFLAHRTMPLADVERIIESNQIDAAMLDGVLSLREVSPPEAEHGIVHLMTSGTTGAPKIARHHLASLRGTIRSTASSGEARWLLAYPATSFAGLQVILSAMLGGGALIAPHDSTPAALCEALRIHCVTHMSGTPSLWRKVLLALNPDEQMLSLRHITLGGEAVDQTTLDRLARQFPNARLRHIYASTEAGVLFTVSDHRAGFPAEFLRDGVEGVAFRVRDGVLEARGPRLMQRYVSSHQSPLLEDGWMSLGDVVIEREGRYYFAGRADARLNVGGYKVFPDQVESALLEVEGVADVRVFGQPGPLAGDVLVAEIVVAHGHDPAELRTRALSHLRATQPSFALPRIVRFTESITISPFQKRTRSHERTELAHCH